MHVNDSMKAYKARLGLTGVPTDAPVLRGLKHVSSVFMHQCVFGTNIQLEMAVDPFVCVRY